MKINRMVVPSVMGSLLMGLGLVISADAQEPQSYPLLCRGGGDYTLRISSGDNSTINARLIYQFQKSSRAATAGLQPGQCAWTDRGINANEPDALAFEFPGAIIAMNARITNGMQSTLFQYGGSSRTAQQIIRAIQGGQEFQVQVYNDRSSGMWSSGLLKVTRIGP